MSEHQYIEFRAVDRPLTDEEMAYAEQQSTRAEISRWCFSNEYHYGSFRGNVDGMLRRGYDVFLKYANYGTRTLKIRLPAGLPFEKKLWSQFIDGEILNWDPDSKGMAGTLVLEPCFEPMDSFWEFDDCLNEVVAVRERLISGDLRALYLLWLCVAGDENFDPTETVEPPVPLGLLDFDLELECLFDFFNIDPLLVNAAANIPLARGKKHKKTQTPAIGSPAERLKPWLKSLSVKQAKEHLQELLVGDTSAFKAEILAAVAKDRANANKSDWPTVELKRTFQELMEQTDILREEFIANEEKREAAKAKRDAAKAVKEREKRLAEMVKDPQKWLTESERLVEERGRSSYKLAAEILADLKEAIGGAKGKAIARKHAAHLTSKHPTLTQLQGSLRKHGVLD